MNDFKKLSKTMIITENEEKQKLMNIIESKRYPMLMHNGAILHWFRLQ